MLCKPAIMQVILSTRRSSINVTVVYMVQVRVSWIAHDIRQIDRNSILIRQDVKRLQAIDKHNAKRR